MPLMWALCACVMRIHRTVQPVFFDGLKEWGVEGARIHEQGFSASGRARRDRCWKNPPARKGKKTSSRRLLKLGFARVRRVVVDEVPVHQVECRPRKVAVPHAHRAQDRRDEPGAVQVGVIEAKTFPFDAHEVDLHDLAILEQHPRMREPPKTEFWMLAPEKSQSSNVARSKKESWIWAPTSLTRTNVAAVKRHPEITAWERSVSSTRIPGRSRSSMRIRPFFGRISSRT